MPNLIISTDLHTGTSGDIVASKELEAIRELDNSVIILDYKDIHPIPNNLPDQPFLIDYLTLHKLHQIDLTNVKLAHMYGGCYLYSIRYLKSKGIKTTYSRMAHDRNISIQEHEKIFGPNSYPFAHVKDNNLWPIYIGGIREADIIICPGDAPKRSLLSEGVKEENIRIIPHGTTIPDESKIRPVSDNPNSFNIGYLGASGPDKGLPYLIQAWSQLNYDDSSLIIAGRGSERLEPFIRKYAIEGRYQLLGYIQNIDDFYNSISIYIQPSSTEAFGMETIEAMSYGRPVIVSNGAGSSDCITDGIDGFVVPSMNSNGIKEKIDWFKNHPKELIEFGKRARENSKKYDWSIIKSRYIDEWRRLLNI